MGYARREGCSMNACMYRSETRSEFCRWTWIDVVQLSLNFSVYLAGYDLSAKRQYRPGTEDIASCADAKPTHLIQVSSAKITLVANKTPGSDEQLHTRSTLT